MNVQDICIRNVATCLPETNLAAAAALMWDHDCGVLPVVDSSQRLTGILTDRDICMALATRGRLASDIQVQDVMSTVLHTIHEDDSVSHAMKTMRHHHVRRLPVLNAGGALKGMLSLNDLALAAKEGKDASPSHDEVVQTLKAICNHGRQSKKGKERLEPALV